MVHLRNYTNLVTSSGNRETFVVWLSIILTVSHVELIVVKNYNIRLYHGHLVDANGIFSLTGIYEWSLNMSPETFGYTRFPITPGKWFNEESNYNNFHGNKTRYQYGQMPLSMLLKIRGSNNFMGDLLTRNSQTVPSTDYINGGRTQRYYQGMLHLTDDARSVRNIIDVRKPSIIRNTDIFKCIARLESGRGTTKPNMASFRIATSTEKKENVSVSRNAREDILTMPIVTPRNNELGFNLFLNSTRTKHVDDKNKKEIYAINFRDECMDGGYDPKSEMHSDYYTIERFDIGSRQTRRQEVADDSSFSVVLKGRQKHLHRRQISALDKIQMGKL